LCLFWVSINPKKALHPTSPIFGFSVVEASVLSVVEDSGACKC